MPHDSRRADAEASSLAGAAGRRPTVSVVIPVKDDAEMLRRCLRALRAQTLTPDEIIVVDNGSSDGSSDVARKAGVRVVLEPEEGILAASAAGFDAADGELLARLDADCVPSQDWLQEIVDAFAADLTVSAVTGGARLIDGPRSLRRILPALYLSAYFGVLGVTLGHVPLFGSNMAIRRESWRAVSDQVHRRDPMVHDDLDIAFHLGRTHRISFVRTLSMGISGRPFGEGRAFATRIRRGFHTVTLHWPGQFPPFRWLDLLVTRQSREERAAADSSDRARSEVGSA